MSQSSLAMVRAPTSATGGAAAAALDCAGTCTRGGMPGGLYQVAMSMAVLLAVAEQAPSAHRESADGDVLRSTSTVKNTSVSPVQVCVATVALLVGSIMAGQAAAVRQAGWRLLLAVAALHAGDAIVADRLCPPPGVLVVSWSSGGPHHVKWLARAAFSQLLPECHTLPQGDDVCQPQDTKP